MQQRANIALHKQFMNALDATAYVWYLTLVSRYIPLTSLNSTHEWVLIFAGCHLSASLADTRRYE